MKVERGCKSEKAGSDTVEKGNKEDGLGLTGYWSL